MEWIANAFRQFIGFFTGGRGEDEAGHTPNEAHHQATGQRQAVVAQEGVGQYSPEEVGGAHSELFDNQYRREAKEQARLREESFKKANEARDKGDHDTANRYVKEVRR